MATISYRPRGGQEGIECSVFEQNELATVIKTTYIDKYIPLPNMSIEEQAELILRLQNEEGDKDGDFDNAIYWENEEGSHGWCDMESGKVVQWG